MSEYPRPPAYVPPEPYPPDRIVAGLLAVLALASTVHSALYRFNRYNQAENATAWTSWFLADILALAIYPWLLWGIARSRFWAFMTTAAFMLLAVGGAASRRHFSVAVMIWLMVALFALSRLCTVIGPRPIRRQDLLRR